MTRFNPDDQPILSLAVSSATKTLPELTTLADQVITRRLNTVPGVGQTAIVGGAERQIQVLLDPERMEAFGVAPATVMDAIRRENQDIAAGTLTAGITGRNVTVEGRITDAAGFERIIVKSDEGAPIRLADVALVREAGAELTSRAAYRGVPALGVDVVKVQDTNTVAVARALRAEIERTESRAGGAGRRACRLARQLALDRRAGRRRAAHADRGRAADRRDRFPVPELLALNRHHGLTLPISVIGTFAVIHAFGFTLNTMTLLALSLAIGILIDDAIVVRENITRHLHMGKSHARAAIDGTEEIGLAVLATTLSIVAVFLPVAFMGGIIGRFFLEFGVTVAVAVLISLFVSFTLDPMLSSVWYDPASQPNAERGPLGRLVARFDRGFERTAARYASLIRWTFRHRVVTLVAILLTFGISLALVPRIGAEFVPAGDRGEFTVSIETPEARRSTTPRARSRRSSASWPACRRSRRTIPRSTPPPRAASTPRTVAVTLKPITERTRATMDLAEPLRERLSRIAGLTVSVNQPSLGGGGGGGANAKPLQVSVLGEGEAELKRLSDEIMARLRAIPGAVEIESSLDDEQPTLAVRVRQEAASDLGVSLQAIGDTLRPLVAGDAISVWNAPDGETYDVLVRLPEAGRARAGQLAELRVASSRQDASGRPILVSLDQVADVVDSVAPSSINRRDLSREVRISANVEGRALGEVVADLQREIAGLTLAPGYRVTFGGEAENMAESFGYAVQALGSR